MEEKVKTYKMDAEQAVGSERSIRKELKRL